MPLQPHLPEATASDAYLEFACEDCGCIFVTKQGLGIHGRLVHDTAIIYMSCIWGSRCPTCDKESSTSPRFLQRIAYDAALSCGASFLASEPLHPLPEDIRRLGGAERAHEKLSVAKGLPARWADVPVQRVPFLVFC